MRAVQSYLAIPLLLLGVVAYGQTSDLAIIENELLTVGFDKARGGLADVFTPDESGDFMPTVPTARLLWELHFRSEEGEELRMDNSQAPAPQVTQAGASLTLKWKDLALAHGATALDVTARCELPSAKDTALLRLWVDNRSVRWGLWDILFPVIRGLGEAGTTDVAMGRGTWGRLFEDPRDQIQGDYPSHSLPMQFILLQNVDHGCYLAAQDPEARFKTFAIQVGGEFRVTTRVNEMGIPGNDWAAPYPFPHGDGSLQRLHPLLRE